MKAHNLFTFETKTGNGEIIYMPYIPVLISGEAAEKRRISRYANKTFAKVKLSNSNPHYRDKECEILKTAEVGGRKRYLLSIETGNTCSKSGMHTLVAFVKSDDSPYWKKIWFDEDEIELVRYDENGRVIKHGKTK